MKVVVVFGQMLVLLAIMAVGYFCYKKKWITDESSGHFSKLLVNVFTPILVVNGVLGQNSSDAGSSVGYNIVFILLYFVILLVLGLVMPLLLRPDACHKSIYRLMTIFSNVGFMGIPVIRSIFGNEAMIYVAFYILAYNIMFYTCGMHLARRAGAEWKECVSVQGRAANDNAKTEVASQGGAASQGAASNRKASGGFAGFLRQMINPGVIAATLAVIIFASGITLPEPVCTFCDYMGNTTIPLSMLLIGVSMAQADVKEVFGDVRIYIFVLLRMVLLPIVMTYALGGIVRAYGIDPVVFGVFIIELGMPVGSIIALMTREKEGDAAYCTKGVVVSTLASIVTIPIICAFL